MKKVRHHSAGGPSSKWHGISTAPRNGIPIRIKGRTFPNDKVYTAKAVWATRKCPQVEVTDWFPATDKHDGQGPFLNVNAWMPLKSVRPSKPNH